MPRNQAVEVSIDLADALLLSMGLKLDEATGEYYYDEHTVKKWILGDGGSSGNCEVCEENVADGDIDQDALFSSGHDEAPAHPNCTCTVEYRDKRFRVYV